MEDRGQLRPYQRLNVEQLKGLHSAALFNEQRTGKTPTALKLVEANGHIDSKVLIITTKSSLYQWRDEYIKWLKRSCVLCSGSKLNKLKTLENWKHGLIVSIDSLKETKSKEGLITHILKHKPQYVIFDEAHKAKDPNSANAKAVFKLREIPWKLALTATPAPGKPYDVFSILKFLFPKEFTSFWKFLDQYFIIKDEVIYIKGSRRTFKSYEEFQPGKGEELQTFMKTFSTQLKRKEVMPWLPDKDYQRISLDTSKQQDKYLQELETDFETEGVEVVGVLDRCVRYRQICNDPGLIDLPTKMPPKTKFLLDYIDDHKDEPIIVFSNFTQYLIKLYKALEKTTKIGMLIGQTPPEVRERLRKDYQTGKFQVFLINIQAGKEALTLDRAETTIFMDKYPPIADIKQAEDRFIATSEDKANKGHLILELCMKDTFDEHIYNLLEQREEEVMIINEWRKWYDKHKPTN